MNANDNERNEREVEMLDLIAGALGGAVTGVYGEAAGFILIVTYPPHHNEAGTRMRMSTNLYKEDCAGALQVIAAEYPARNNVTPRAMTPAEFDA